MVAVTEDERAVAGDVRDRRRALGGEEFGEEVEGILLAGPPPGHVGGAEVDVAGRGPADGVEDDADEGAGALRLVQFRRDFRAAQEGESVEAGDDR